MSATTVPNGEPKDVFVVFLFFLITTSSIGSRKPTKYTYLPLASTDGMYLSSNFFHRLWTDESFTQADETSQFSSVSVFLMSALADKSDSFCCSVLGFDEGFLL
jgi:hypothetical protein